MGVFKMKKPLFDSTKTVHYTDTYRIGGKSIICPQCGQNKFDEGTALLNTPGMTFFGLDWANRTTTILACRGCGRIEWFLRQPEEVK